MPRHSISALSIPQMLAEIKRRKRTLTKLVTRRRKLARQLAALDQEIALAGGLAQSVASVSAPARRPRNKVTLVDAMAKVMSATQPMSVSQIATAVGKIGYKSVSKTFKTIIFQTLGRDKRFRKQARGLYVLRK